MKLDQNNDQEKTRLASLNALNILDSEPEATYDGLVEVAATACEVPISLISLIDTNRQWFKANAGLQGTSETPRDVAFCSHTIKDVEDILEIPDATADPRFSQNPLVTGEPRIRFYAGAKLTLSNGATIGTLCIIDRKPKQLTHKQRLVLRNLANALVDLLEARGIAEQLAVSESRFRGLCDAAPLGIFGSDQTGACDYTNTQCQNLLGKSEQQLLGHGWQEALHDDDKEEVLNQLRNTLEKQRTFNEEFRIVDDEGDTRYVRSIAAPIFSAKGVLSGTIGIIEDTTKNILEKKALAEERSRLASIIKGTGAGTWEWNVQTGEFRVNQRFREICGHPDLPFSSVKETRDLIHPDDLKKSDEALSRHLEGNSKRYDFERRIKHHDGKWGWVLDCGQVVTKTADNKPEWLFGTRLNISEHKLQAEQLSLAKEQMATDQRRNALTQERLRLARDMHDTLAHSLMALLTQIRVVRKLRKKLPEQKLEHELENLEQVAVSGIAEARAAIAQMRHNDVKEIGLDSAIQSLCDRFSEQTGIKTVIHIDKHESALVQRHAETLFRITEEALHNVERHSKAKLVSIDLSPLSSSGKENGEKLFRLGITDNGVGFTTPESRPGHYGIRGMEEQVALIDGEFTLLSKPGHGTTVKIEFSV